MPQPLSPSPFRSDNSRICCDHRNCCCNRRDRRNRDCPHDSNGLDRCRPHDRFCSGGLGGGAPGLYSNDDSFVDECGGNVHSHQWGMGGGGEGGGIATTKLSPSSRRCGCGGIVNHDICPSPPSCYQDGDDCRSDKGGCGVAPKFEGGCGFDSKFQSIQDTKPSSKSFNAKSNLSLDKVFVVVVLSMAISPCQPKLKKRTYQFS